MRFNSFYSRRDLLKLALYATVSSLLSYKLNAKNNFILKDKKIIIIGAGISGLSAANKLAHYGAKVKVLEANNYIGGRIKTDWSFGNDAPFEAGAGWIHGPSSDNPTKKLADKVGCEYFLTNDDNVTTFDEDGSEWGDERWEEVLRLWENTLLKVDKKLELNDKRSLRKAIEDINPKALQYPGVLWAFSAYTEFDKGTSIEKVSAVYHDDDKAFPRADVIIKNGYSSLINNIAKNLDISLNTKVKSINTNLGKVIEIQTEKEIYTCDFAICSVPLGILKAKRINFIPDLPDKHKKSIENIGFGSVTKIAHRFDKPFWDTKIQYFGINTKEKGRWNYWLNYRTFSKQNILLGLSVGDYAFIADKLSEREKKADSLNVLRNVWGKNISEPNKSISTKWSKNQNFLGAYSYTKPGAKPKDYENLSKPINNKLFFCGEHTIFDFSATTHGALLSGLNVARKIIEIA